MNHSTNHNGLTSIVPGLNFWIPSIGPEALNMNLTVGSKPLKVNRKPEPITLSSGHELSNCGIIGPELMNLTSWAGAFQIELPNLRCA